MGITSWIHESMNLSLCYREKEMHLQWPTAWCKFRFIVARIYRKNYGSRDLTPSFFFFTIFYAIYAESIPELWSDIQFAINEMSQTHT